MFRKLAYLPLICLTAHIYSFPLASNPVVNFFNKLDRKNKMIAVGAGVALPLTYLVGKGIISSINSTHDKNLIKTAKKALKNAHKEFDIVIVLAKEFDKVDTDYIFDTKLDFSSYVDKAQHSLKNLNLKHDQVKKRLEELKSAKKSNKTLTMLQDIDREFTALENDLSSVLNVFPLYLFVQSTKNSLLPVHQLFDTSITLAQQDLSKANYDELSTVFRQAKDAINQISIGRFDEQTIWDFPIYRAKLNSSIADLQTLLDATQKNIKQYNHTSEKNKLIAHLVEYESTLSSLKNDLKNIDQRFNVYNEAYILNHHNNNCKLATLNTHQIFDTSIALAQQDLTKATYSEFVTILLQAKDVINQISIGRFDEQTIWDFPKYISKLNSSATNLQTLLGTTQKNIKQCNNASDKNPILPYIIECETSLNCLQNDLRNVEHRFNIYYKAYLLHHHYNYCKESYKAEFNLLETISDEPALKQALMKQVLVRNMPLQSRHPYETYAHTLQLCCNDFSTKLHNYRANNNQHACAPEFEEEMIKFGKQLYKIYELVTHDNPAYLKEIRATEKTVRLQQQFDTLENKFHANINALESRFNARQGELKSDLTGSIKSEISAVERSLRNEVEAVKYSLKNEIASAQSSLQSIVNNSQSSLAGQIASLRTTHNAHSMYNY